MESHLIVGFLINWTVGLIKKILLYKISYFPEPYTRGEKKVELDLSNYATKSDLKTQQMLIHQILLKRVI